MATIDDLEREIRKLRTRLDELKGVGREQAQVAELVSNDADRNHPGDSSRNAVIDSAVPVKI